MKDSVNSLFLVTGATEGGKNVERGQTGKRVCSPARGSAELPNLTPVTLDVILEYSVAITELSM